MYVSNSLIPLLFASRSTLSVGSEPMERKQIIGAWGVLSAHIASRSRMTPSANCNTQSGSGTYGSLLETTNTGEDTDLLVQNQKK